MSTQAAPDRFLPREDARLRWRIDGTGPTLVLLHGWALDLDYWRPAVPLLAPHFTLLRFDRRGFGLSGGMPDPAMDVADLTAVMQTAGVQRATLVGMSQGARLALRFAHALPGKVRALVLDGAPALEAEPELPLDELRRLLQSGGRAALHAAIRAHPLMRLARDDEANRQLLDAILARYHGLDLLHPPRALPQADVTAIAAPALLLHGSDDTAGRRQAAAALQSALPQARRIELRDAGHLALLDDPAGYARAVTDFHRELPPDGAWPPGRVLPPG